MEFNTRFNVADCKNKNKVYDRHDNVDRLSYVDNTLMIKRFVQEGKSLAMARAKALRSGQFLNAKDAYQNDEGIAVPVYEMDPAVSKPIIDQMTNKLNTASVDNAKTTINDDNAKSTDAVNDSSSDSK